MSVTWLLHAAVTVKDMDAARRIWNLDPERVRVAFLPTVTTSSVTRSPPTRRTS
jgi:hypothetical protein